MQYVTSMVIGKVHSEKLTKLSLEAMPDVCNEFGVVGGKWVEPSSNGVRRLSINLQLIIGKAYYIERNTLIQQSSQKVVKCIFFKKIFFQWIRSETKWLHWGKECNRPVFSQDWGVGAFLIIYLFSSKRKMNHWYLPTVEPNSHMALKISYFKFS